LCVLLDPSEVPAIIALRVLAVAVVLSTAVAAVGCGGICGDGTRCTTSCDTCSNVTGLCVPRHPPTHAVARACAGANCTAGCTATVWPFATCFKTPDGAYNKAYCHDPAPGKLTMYRYLPGDDNDYECFGPSKTRVLPLDRCLADVAGVKHLELSCTSSP
jgi:hypothetical protein